MQYPAIVEMSAQLESEYAEANDPELLRSLARQHAEKTMILRIGRTVVYALAKQLNKEWDQKALEIASSPECLSVAADELLDTANTDLSCKFPIQLVLSSARSDRLVYPVLAR